jgi:hypothetical protein
MMDEYWMRGWNSNHQRFSADIASGLTKLLQAFDRFAEMVTPSHREGADTYFMRTVRACGEMVAAITGPKSKPH